MMCDSAEKILIWKMERKKIGIFKKILVRKIGVNNFLNLKIGKNYQSMKKFLSWETVIYNWY